MDKKNGLTTIVIVILSILVGLLGGYIIFNNISNQDRDPQVNNGEQNGDNEEKDFSLEEAKKLMDKYKLEGLCGEYYINNLSNPAAIKELSIRRSAVTGELSYGEVSKTTTFSEAKEYMVEDETKTFSYYAYDNVYTSAKELFGPAIKLEKANDFTNCDSTWYYLKEYDKFVQLELGCGGDCMGGSTTLSVYDFEVSDDVLYIYTTREMVSDSDITVIKNKYTFKKQNAGYYMSAVEKIK